MKDTTLCYIEKDGKYLMLHRNKKKNDLNEGKWIGVGGKFEPGETAEECLLREVYEETGVKLTSYRYRGIIYFISDVWEDEAMYLYTADAYEGEISFDCDEGELAWVDKDKILDLRLWEGDRFFLEALLADRDITMTLHYDKNDNLIEVKKDVEDEHEHGCGGHGCHEK